MKNRIVKSAGVLAIASLMTTTAFSQITIGGYVEAGFMTGNTGSNTLVRGTTKGFGGETVITVAGKGSLTNGWTYSAYQSFDSDDSLNGRDTAGATTQIASVMTTRAIEISPSKDFKLFYTYDGVFGGEIARTAVPVVTERAVDLTGASGLSEFIDVTSGTHAMGFEILNVGPAGRFSVAYAPNLDGSTTSSSDRPFSGTGQTGTVGSTAAGYSVGYVVQPGPIKVALGFTKIDQRQAGNNQDVDSKTLGVQYIGSSYAIGAQRTKNESTKIAITTPGVKDSVDTVAASYALSKELTAGLAYSKMDRDITGSVSGPENKVIQAVVAYNLGPVVASIAYEDSKDQKAGTLLTTATGMDTTITKIKVKANF
jgi:hypothetical protein